MDVSYSSSVLPASACVCALTCYWFVVWYLLRVFAHDVEHYRLLSNIGHQCCIPVPVSSTAYRSVTVKIEILHLLQLYFVFLVMQQITVVIVAYYRLG